MTKRKAREGRCPRCDRPLTDIRLVKFGPDITEAILFDEPAPSTSRLTKTHVWIAERSDDKRCGGHRGRECNGDPVDWRARALAAEATLIAKSVDDE